MLARGCMLGTVIAAALVAGGCGGDDARSPAAATTAPATAGAGAARRQRPRLCGRLRATVSGRVPARAGAHELSGLALSQRRRGVLWTHNDSGDGARVLAIGARGGLRADVRVSGAEHVDWEDLAIGPGGALYVGDIGDNPGERDSISVYRVPEPALGARASAPARRYELRYEDGPRDAEALLVDRASGAIVVVEKRYEGSAGVYVAQRPRAAAPVTLRRRASIGLGPSEAVTAGDVSRDGRTIVLRTYFSAFVWQRRAGETIAAALRRAPCRAGVDLIGEGQGEALALSADGGSFHTVAEEPSPALRAYAPAGR